ncbi:MAG: hypothetical protein JO096_09040 [Alphaproteobacteria bacterium]|nr:hypothetical protein [Alphaproteobacteria bacterium]
MGRRNPSGRDEVTPAAAEFFEGEAVPDHNSNARSAAGGPNVQRRMVFGGVGAESGRQHRIGIGVRCREFC